MADQIFSQQLDDKWANAWDAMEAACVALQELNDICYGEDGEPLHRVPRIQANVLMTKAKEISLEASTFDAIKEPSRALPSLPSILV